MGELEVDAGDFDPAWVFAELEEPRSSTDATDLVSETLAPVSEDDPAGDDSDDCPNCAEAEESQGQETVEAQVEEVDEAAAVESDGSLRCDSDRRHDRRHRRHRPRGVSDIGERVLGGEQETRRCKRVRRELDLAIREARTHYSRGLSATDCKSYPAADSSDGCVRWRYEIDPASTASNVLGYVRVAESPLTHSFSADDGFHGIGGASPASSASMWLIMSMLSRRW